MFTWLRRFCAATESRPGDHLLGISGRSRVRVRVRVGARARIRARAREDSDSFCLGSFRVREGSGSFFS